MFKMPEVTNYQKKDNTYCCVPLCKSRGSKNPDLSFHLFPSEKRELARRKKWILALRIGRPVTSRMSVCSRHFVHSDYVLPPHYERKRPRLRQHAVPSLNLPPPEGYDLKPEKRPTTIRIGKEPTSPEAEGEESEENDEQEEFEIEVNIRSEQDYFGTHFNNEYEQDCYGTDLNSESEQDYFGTDYNNVYKTDYFGTNYNNESVQNYLERIDNIESKQDHLETEGNVKSYKDYFDTEDNIDSQQDDLDTFNVSDSELEQCIDNNDTEYQQDYLKRKRKMWSKQEYLEIEDSSEVENDVESEQEDILLGKNIKPMTLTTLSKILI